MKSFTRLEKVLAQTMRLAIKNISDDWSRCDDSTGNECPRRICSYGEHRAAAMLEDMLIKYFRYYPGGGLDAKTHIA